MATTPAAELKGLTLGDWLVLELIDTKADSTGGFFSSQYKVQNQVTGKKAFLKAIDLWDRLAGSSGLERAETMERGLRHFRYETGLLKLCEKSKLDRIVKALDSGIHEYDVITPMFSLLISIPYIIFELAEGDLRTHPKVGIFNLGWRLRVFHGVLAAVQQLHGLKIAHQDLKPSNILVFDEDFGKIADLGRSTQAGNESDYSSGSHNGDRNYFPFELLYGEYLSDSWSRRHFGADFFMMGTILTYLLTDSSFSVLVFEKLDRSLWPNRFGSYDKAIPHLQNAVEQVLQDIRDTLPPVFANEIISYIYLLCNPDYKLRGWPHFLSKDCGIENVERSDVVSYQYNLELAISRFDNMATRAMSSAYDVNSIADGRSFWKWYGEEQVK
jgi:serine/threonine protein kinase